MTPYNPIPQNKPTALTEAQLSWCRGKLLILGYPVFEIMEQRRFTRPAQ